uniref:Uncharacterized protein n=1 Tax=Vespula pensylvanica TaxID=30213 RepID=A0A834P658_VESPE|nr:hypothetical protein H0235_006050 [Vespula pensylvanica]
MVKLLLIYEIIRETEVIRNNVISILLVGSMPVLGNNSLTICIRHRGLTSFIIEFWRRSEHFAANITSNNSNNSANWVSEEVKKEKEEDEKKEEEGGRKTRVGVGDEDVSWSCARFAFRKHDILTAGINRSKWDSGDVSFVRYLQAKQGHLGVVRGDDISVDVTENPARRTLASTFLQAHRRN